MRVALGARGRLSQRIAPLFSNLAADYSVHAKANLADATWRKVRVYQVATLRDFFGRYRLTDLSTELVDDYKDERRKAVRPSSVNNELRVFGTMLRWARDDRTLPVADFKIRKLKVSGERRVHAWTVPELAKLYAAAAKKDLAFVPMIEFLLNTGCRKGEAIAAEWTWVDDGRRLLSIPVTDSGDRRAASPARCPWATRSHARWQGSPEVPVRVPELSRRAVRGVPEQALRRHRRRGRPDGRPAHVPPHLREPLPTRRPGPVRARARARPFARPHHRALHPPLPGHLERSRNAVNLPAFPENSPERGQSVDA